MHALEGLARSNVHVIDVGELACNADLPDSDLMAERACKLVGDDRGEIALGKAYITRHGAICPPADYEHRNDINYKSKPAARVTHVPYPGGIFNIGVME